MNVHASSRGFTLAELLTTVAIIGVMVSITLPQFNGIRRRSAMRAAAREISSVFRDARSTSIARAKNVAVRFAQRPDGWTYTLFEDGDFDGVRSDDIAAGIDKRITVPRLVLQGIGTASIAMPRLVLTDPDTGDAIDTKSSPVKFGTPRMASFAPTGGGTAGSVYVSDGFDNVAIVRVFGSTGRVRTLFYDGGARRWRL